MFISEANPNAIEGVRRVLYQTPKPDQEQVHPAARDFELAARRAEIVAGMARNLKALGFTPDIVIGHHGWGEMLNLRDVFPGGAGAGLFRVLLRTDGQDVNYDPEFPMHADALPAHPRDERGQPCWR